MRLTIDGLTGVFSDKVKKVENDFPQGLKLMEECPASDRFVQ